MRFKAMLMISVTTVVLFGLLYGIVSMVVTNRFAELERVDGEGNTQRVLQALAQEMVGLDASVKDWAWWDDTYAYAENGNEAYQTDNLTAGAIAVLRLNWLVIVNAEGKMVYGVHYDPGTDILSPLDPNRLQDLGLWPLPAEGGVGVLVGAAAHCWQLSSPFYLVMRKAPPRESCFLEEP